MKRSGMHLGVLLALALSLALQCCEALVVPGPLAVPVMRMRGGKEEAAAAGAKAKAAAKAGESETASALRESAARRLQQTKTADRSSGGIFKRIGKIFFSISNRMGITGASTRVVNGKILLSRNPIQKVFHGIYLLLRAIFLFFKTLFVPLKTLDAPKPAGGPGRGSFANTNRKREMRMADLPPMPGG